MLKKKRLEDLYKEGGKRRTKRRKSRTKRRKSRTKRRKSRTKFRHKKRRKSRRKSRRKKRTRRRRIKRGGGGSNFLNDILETEKTIQKLDKDGNPTVSKDDLFALVHEITIDDKNLTFGGKNTFY